MEIATLEEQNRLLAVMRVWYHRAPDPVSESSFQASAAGSWPLRGDNPLRNRTRVSRLRRDGNCAGRSKRA
jgi:hypothetical protein